MRISVSIGSAYYDGENGQDVVEYVKAADRLGVDSAWSAEAWGMEAVTPLAYMAGITEQIKLGSGIMQINARTPGTAVLTALSMAQISGDRFILGLGVSGPQVVEGWHGVGFAKPLGRLREYIEIVRMGLRGERLVYEGEHYVLPRPGGEGKALKSSIPPRPDLPIYLATLGPKALELTGQLADGWLGTSFIPEAADTMIGKIAAGAEAAGRSIDDIDIQVNATIEVSDDVDSLIAKHKPGMAFTLGGMGSASTNFYNAAISRAGYSDIAAEVQRLWVEGDKAAATAAVPDELVLAANIIGTPDMVRSRIGVYRDAGVKCLRVRPVGKTPAQQIEHLEMVMDLVD